MTEKENVEHSGNNTTTEAGAYREGFTLISLLGIVYASLVLLPANLFSILVTNSNIAFGLAGPPIGYVVALLFAEVAHLAGKRISKQDLFIIWSCSAIAAGETVVLTVFGQYYYRSICPFTWAFTDPASGRPMPLVIPGWYAPSPSSPIFFTRSVWHQDFLYPLAIFLLSFVLSTKLMSLPLGFMAYQLFVVEEKLPFPVQIVQSEQVLLLSEREPEKFRVMTLAALAAAGYSVLTYITHTIPLPWDELKGLMTTLEASYPGIMFGIGTDAILVAIGMVLPLTVSLGIFIGSASVFLAANPILRSMGLLPKWQPGAGIAKNWTNVLLDFWISPLIGITIAASLVPLLFASKSVVSAFKSFSKISKVARQKGIPPFKYLAFLFVLASVGEVILIHYLIPDFPIWLMAFFVVVWPVISTVIVSYSLGITGQGIDIPNVDQAFRLSGYIVSDYQGIGIWYAPLFISVSSGFYSAGWVSWFKVCDLTKTKLTSYVKGAFAASICAWIFSGIYMDLFWKLAPIPSETYWATQFLWPIGILQHLPWVTRSATYLRIDLIVQSFALAAIISAVTLLIRSPIPFISVAAGMVTPIPFSFTIFIGALISKALMWYLGRKRWLRLRPSFAAGIILGESVIITIAAALIMVDKSIWNLPW